MRALRLLPTIPSLLAFSSFSSCSRRSSTVQLNEVELQLPPHVMAAHDKAVAEKEELYFDPDTGNPVFTKIVHLRKSQCCGSCCRHCPFEFENAPSNVNCVSAIIEGRSQQIKKKQEKANVRSPKVYTRTGDKGTSALYNGERRPKDDLIFEALGAIDELSSNIGLAREFLSKATCGSSSCPDECRKWQGNYLIILQLPEDLERIQQRLLDVGSIVATPHNPSEIPVVLQKYLPTKWTQQLEASIDAMEQSLPPLTSFIVSTGSVPAAQMHVARSVCRRAERALVRAVGSSNKSTLLQDTLIFLNRLSDFLFVAARCVSREDIKRERTPKEK